MSSNPRLDAAYAAQVKAVRARVESFAQARFVGQHRSEDAARFVASVVPVVLAARRQVSSLTDAYLAQVLTSTLGRKVAPRGPIDTDLLRGVAPDEVYARPYVTVWTKLSEGLPYDAAVSAGTARLTDVLLGDMQMAKRNTAQAVFSQTDGVKGYRRTLTGSKNCALCYLASSQFYHREDLLPIHPGCDCGVDPVADGETPDKSLVTATHEAVEDRLGASDGGGRAPDYRKQLIVHEHGELGPVLAVRGQHFAGRSVMDA